VTIQNMPPGISISSSGVTVEPVSGRIGAEISGLDISQPLDDSTVEIVLQALDQWKVVFFRGQELDHAAQITFGRRFGGLTYAHPHDDAPPDGYPEIYTVDDRRLSARLGFDAKARRAQTRSLTSGWHTDVTPAINPPAGSILRADVVPSFGGDTTAGSRSSSKASRSLKLRSSPALTEPRMATTVTGPGVVPGIGPAAPGPSPATGARPAREARPEPAAPPGVAAGSARW
jgi:alpha-ketoglutarate-dependent sulfate ester dioxygenase